MANAAAPGWRRQQSAKTESDIFDDEDQTPESPAAARALRMLNSKPRPEAPTFAKKKTIPPVPRCAVAMSAADAPLPSTLMGSNAQQAHQRKTPPSPRTRIEPRHHLGRCNSASGKPITLVLVQAKPKAGKSTWPISKTFPDPHTVIPRLGGERLRNIRSRKNERVRRANIRQKDVEIGDLRGRIERPRRDSEGLRRRADGETGEVKREVAQLKGVVPWM